MKTLIAAMVALCTVSTAFAEPVNSPGPEKQTALPPEEMVFVKGGCFDMGERELFSHVHRVCLSDFYIGKYEVTQSLYEKVTGNNPSNFGGCPDCPVERVTWDEANAYCKKVENRLPTEAEWEYAARSGGGKKELLYAGTKGSVFRYAWIRFNSGGKTHPVGQLKPNELGLYDMSGNVAEWVADFFSRDYYRNSPELNPKGPQRGGANRVVRGGAWDTEGWSTTKRDDGVPDFRGDNRGFRCASNLVPNAINKSPAVSSGNEDLRSRLEKAKKAFDDGLITEEEYKTKRSQIIKEY